jgi:hypothetical protein
MVKLGWASTKLAKAMMKKLFTQVKAATITTASPLHVLFLQCLACSLKNQVPVGLFEAAERILDPMD